MVPVATMTPVTAMLHLVMVLVAHLIVTTVIVVARVCVAVGHVLVTFVVLVAHLTVALVMFVVIVVHLTVTAMLHLVIVLVTAMVLEDRKSTRLNSSHVAISYAVFCLKKKRTLLCL